MLASDLKRVVHAQLVACRSHGSQVRKNTGLPYILHPSRVADSISLYLPWDLSIKNQVDLYCAAYLHDTLEDTNLTEDEILKDFGQDVLKLVKELTSDSQIMATFDSKGAYLLDKMQRMSCQALFIKLLDRLDNISDYRNECGINSETLKSAKKYAAQTLQILDGLGFQDIYGPIIEEIRRISNEIQCF
jgi:(p)ppGpp synthase/HD superfamily hydrolase